jgi:hypothetical protein
MRAGSASTYRNVAGMLTHMANAQGTELFPRTLPGAPPAAAVAEVSDGCTADPVVPLFSVSRYGGQARVRSQIRYLAEDTCFVHITEQPLTTADKHAITARPELARAVA